MSSLVVLNLGKGSWRQGFPTVIVQIWDGNRSLPMQSLGSLPACPELFDLYQTWKAFYKALHARLGWQNRGIEMEPDPITNVSPKRFQALCQQLQIGLNQWLSSDAFRPIDQRLRTELSTADDIRLILEAEDPQVRQLPWHLWSFFDDYPNAEVALSIQTYKPISVPPRRATGTVRILAVLGDSQGIDIEHDRALLEQLPQSETRFLIEPNRIDLDRCLWDEQGWDILFFAGHSASDLEGETGQLHINQTDALSIEQLRNALKAAIARGLKIAIFNSCDGLGLARSLADLHIPQLMVMREPVPDRVAQEFLKHLLTAFAGGLSLYLAERQARERLQGMEGEFPCASWLPVICQNPAELPPTWQDLQGSLSPAADVDESRLPTSRPIDQPPPRQERSPVLKQRRGGQVCLFASIITTTLVIGLRSLGWLQGWELAAFDQLMRFRPAEPTDSRFLIVTVSESDIQYQDQQGMARRGSLSDTALKQLLDKLNPHQPRVIGLDIYHDFEFEPALAADALNNPSFFAICQIGQTVDHPDSIAPPPGLPQPQLGFSEFGVDADNVVRRQIFGMAANRECPTDKSLNFQVAMSYLQQGETTEVEWTADRELKIGDRIFRKFVYNAGGYQLSPSEAYGYQVLLNYRSSEPRQESLKAILDGSLDAQLPELVRDRIVLIGAQTSGDQHITPLSQGAQNQKVPGVVIHAQMASQILSAVLDHRPLIWWLPQWSETIWIGCWSIMGGLLVWQFPVSRILMLTVSGGVALLYGICFIGLLQGGWIPLVPAAIAFLGSSGGVIACGLYTGPHVYAKRRSSSQFEP